MKSTTIITTAVIAVLTLTTVGLGSKLILDKSKDTENTASAIASGPIKQITSSPIEKPKIISVVPKYVTTQTPYKKCAMVNQTQMVKNDNKDGTTGGVIGGTTGAVAGGVIGKQIGGNTTGTIIGGVVGLVGGALAGNKIQKATQPDQVAQTNQVKQCNQAMKTVKKLSGYTVTYNYNGVIDTVVLKNKPVGQYLPLSAIGE